MAISRSRRQYNAIVSAIIGTVVQTFKSIAAWGGNISAPASTSGNAIYSNAFFNGARMNKPGQPGVNATRDATTGYPVEAFYVCLAQAQSNGTTLVDGAISAGTYNWTYSYPTGSPSTLTMQSTGSNTPVCIGVSGFALGTPVVNGGTTVQPFSFTLAPQGTVTLSFSAPITDTDCPIDGQLTTVGGPLFRSTALNFYAKLPIIRTLDFLSTNTRTDITWSQRPPNYTGPQLAQDIQSWERAIAFMLAIKNYPGSKTVKWMVNIPPYCDEDYVTQLVTLFNSMGVPAHFIELENANETWNPSFSTLFRSYENAAMHKVNGIANYELNANSVGPAPEYIGDGQIISSMSIDTSGLCTVTLTVPCSSLLDLTTSLPYIVNGATAIVSAAAPVFNANGLVADISRTVTISNVSTSSFQYTTGSVGSASSAPGSTQIYFNPTSSYLADNLSYSISSMRIKYNLQRTFRAQQLWQAVRPRSIYGDRWYFNMSALGGFQAANRLTAFEFTYATYLGSGNAGSWLDAAAVATYSRPSGTVASLSDLYNPAMSTSLYAALNGTAVSLNVDNSCRALTYQCIMTGIQPISYEGGVALQTTSSASYVVPFASDPRSETYLTVHQNVVLQNGVRFMNFFSSPRTYINGSTGNSSWQSCQSYSDSTEYGDPSYSAKNASLQKYSAPVFYSNINGHDLTTLDVLYYQNATKLTGNDTWSIFTQSTTGAIYWGIGSTAVTRNVDWVYCNNTLTPRQVVVVGTDSQATPVKVYAYPPDLSGPILLGTVHLAVNGITSSSNASACTACLDPITWTPTMHGSYVIRIVMDSGTGTAPGIKSVKFI